MLIDEIKISTKNLSKLYTKILKRNKFTKKEFEDSINIIIELNLNDDIEQTYFEIFEEAEKLTIFRKYNKKF